MKNKLTVFSSKVLPPRDDIRVEFTGRNLTKSDGHQQRSSVGYNPKEPGRASFHPLFCFNGETRDFLHGIFRL